MAVSSSGTVYTANYGANTVSVIDGATNTVTATITLGSFTLGTAITGPDGSFDATFIGIDCAVVSGTLTATSGASSATTSVTLTPCSPPVVPAFAG